MVGFSYMWAASLIPFLPWLLSSTPREKGYSSELLNSEFSAIASSLSSLNFCQTCLVLHYAGVLHLHQGGWRSPAYERKYKWWCRSRVSYFSPTVAKRQARQVVPTVSSGPSLSGLQLHISPVSPFTVTACCTGCLEAHRLEQWKAERAYSDPPAGYRLAPQRTRLKISVGPNWPMGYFQRGTVTKIKGEFRVSQTSSPSPL